jgi:hypothetical protein
MVNNIVQAIHADFSFDLLEGIREANKVAHLQRVKPEMVPFDKFEARVRHYRETYPNSNFITERQIQEICLKYGLVFGSLLNFSGEIPIKNRLEISRFELRQEDHYLVDHDLPSRIYRQISGELSGSIGSNFIELRSGHVPANPSQPFDVVPVGKSIILLREIDDRYYRVFLKMDFHGSPWLLELGRGSVDYGEVVMSWRQSFGGNVWDNGRSAMVINHFVDVAFRMSFSQIQRANKLSLSANVSPMVVADRSMFWRYKEATEVVGHRLQFKEGAVAVDNRTFHRVDDPIILQPVEFGYLVVTKWGAEANIGQFNNPAHN